MSDESSVGLSSVLVAIFLVLGGAALLAPGLSELRAAGCYSKGSANLRGLVQSMVIFSMSNTDHFPGLDLKGNLRTASLANTGSTTQTGAATAARFWILLDQKHIGADLLIDPNDVKTPWTPMSPLTTQNYSYAALQIGDSPSATSFVNHEGRASEWKNNANSQAVVLSERNSGAGVEDSQATREFLIHSSYFWGLFSSHSRVTRPWMGYVVWGDGHAGFEQKHLGFETKYGTTKNTNDNLFVYAGRKNVTEGSTVPSANALMNYE